MPSKCRVYRKLCLSRRKINRLNSLVFLQAGMRETEIVVSNGYCHLRFMKSQQLGKALGLPFDTMISLPHGQIATLHIRGIDSITLKRFSQTIFKQLLISKDNFGMELVEFSIFLFLYDLRITQLFGQAY